MLRDLVKSPWYTLAIAVMVLASGLLDMAELVFENWIQTPIGVEHGVVAWGLGHALRATIDICEGINRVTPERGFAELSAD